MTQESEQEQRRRTPEMEEGISGIANLQASYDETERLTKCNLVLGEVRHLFT